MSPWQWRALSSRLLPSINGITNDKSDVLYTVFFLVCFIIIPLFSFLIYMSTPIELIPRFIKSTLFCHSAAFWWCVLETWGNSGLAQMMGGSFLLCLCTNQRKYQHYENKSISNFRKTLLVQFSREMSDKPICKYHIAVYLKKVSFYCTITICFYEVSVIFFKQCCIANILSCCVNEIDVQVVRVCPLTGLQRCVRVHACSSQSPSASRL